VQVCVSVRDYASVCIPCVCIGARLCECIGAPVGVWKCVLVRESVSRYVYRCARVCVHLCKRVYLCVIVYIPVCIGDVCIFACRCAVCVLVRECVWCASVHLCIPACIGARVCVHRCERVYLCKGVTPRVCIGARVCVCRCASKCTSVRACGVYPLRVSVRVCTSVLVCVSLCAHRCASIYVRACVSLCVHQCASVRVHLCERVYLCVCFCYVRVYI
jgi:hypothetical protein